MRLLKGEEDLEVANTKNLLGLSLANQGKYEEAEQLYSTGLKTTTRLVGESHIYSTSLQNALAIVWRSQGRLDEMELALRKLLAIERREHGDWSRTY